MGNFSNLPSDILLDIVTRLPTESILDCKIVCKPWRKVISHHPSFSRMHLTRILNQSDDSSGKLSFLVLAENQQLYYFDYNENHDEKPVDGIRRINLTPPFTSAGHMVLGSSNGLVCLYGFKNYTACICNPVTREYVMLPKFSRDLDPNQYIHWSCGFGYLPLSNEYKVVEMYKLRKDLYTVEVAVYTLGSGNGWRNVGRLDTKFAKVYDGQGVFVNGALYWRDKREGRVLVFDLTEEKFTGRLSPPPLPRDGLWYQYTVGELGGFLYYAIRCTRRATECFDIWLLKNKNDIPDMEEQVGWSKLFCLPEREPLAFTKSGSVLCFDYDTFGIFDPIASVSKELMNFSAFNQMFRFKTTLVSLKDLGEEDIKVMESAEATTTKQPAK